MSSPDQRIEELGLTLPPAPKPMGVYAPVMIVDDMVYLSGHGPLQPDGTLIQGRIGDDLDLDAGYAAARQTGLAIIAKPQAITG